MEEKFKKYFVLSLLVICFLSLIVGAFNSIALNSKAKNEKTKKLQNVFKSSSSKIALIKLNGIIEASENQTSFLSQDLSSQNVLKSLKRARLDNSVKGVLLKINTPGGTVAMSQNIYQEIIRLRKIKPIIVLMEDVAASGGYYIACASDRIVAQEGTLTGSIGVIMQTMDAHKLIVDKLGLKPNVIKSGAFKDAGSSTREMTQQERFLFQNIVNDSYNQFLIAIENGRVKRNDNYSTPKQTLTKENLYKYADGRIFTGRQALNLGFVDMLGDIDIAIFELIKMSGEKFKTDLSRMPVMEYNESQGFSQMLFGATNSIFKQNSFEKYLPASMNMSNVPLYLWE